MVVSVVKTPSTEPSSTNTPNQATYGRQASTVNSKKTSEMDVNCDLECEKKGCDPLSEMQSDTKYTLECDTKCDMKCDTEFDTTSDKKCDLTSVKKCDIETGLECNTKCDIKCHLKFPRKGDVTCSSISNDRINNQSSFNNTVNPTNTRPSANTMRC